MSSMSLEKLKSAIAATEMVGNLKRYPRELRESILEYSYAGMGSGKSRGELAIELGMKRWTLDRWHQDEDKARRGSTMSVGRFGGTTKVTNKSSAARPAPAPSSGPAKFMEVAWPNSAMPMTQAKVSAGHREFQVRCPNGFEVRVPGSFDESTLRRLLRTLEVS
jgi:hypothetical protein